MNLFGNFSGAVAGLAIAIGLMTASQADATQLKFVWAYNDQAQLETWYLNTADLVADNWIYDTSNFIMAPIRNDSTGQSFAYFGNAATDNQFGTGTLQVGEPYGVYPVHSDYAPMPFFRGSNTNPELLFQPGTVFAWTGGTTLSVSAAPEPTSWALMMIGVGGMGAALRARRRMALTA